MNEHGNLRARYEQMMAIDRQLTSTFDLDVLLNQIVSVASDLVESEKAVILLADPNDCEMCRAATSAVADTHEISPDIVVLLAKDSIAGRAAASGEPQIVHAEAGIPPGCCSDHEKSGAKVRDLLSVPLRVQDTVIGALKAINKNNNQPWTEDDVETLQQFGNQAAIAIQKAIWFQEELERKRMEEELKVARQIQLSLLPKRHPSVPGWELAMVYRPARLVGGDFYDFFPVPGDRERLGIVMADVADKGVPAALFMAVSRTIIRTTATMGDNPAQTLIRANRLITQDSQATGQFVSVFYGTMEPQTGRLTYANAGHNRPLWWEASTGQIYELGAKGIVLGVLERIELEERAIDVGVGDVLLFYTDGVTEAVNTNDEEFGEERLRTTVANHVLEGAQVVLDAVVEAVNDFVGGATQFDDFTLYVIKRTEDEQ